MNDWLGRCAPGSPDPFGIVRVIRRTFPMYLNFAQAEEFEKKKN